MTDCCFVRVQTYNILIQISNSALETVMLSYLEKMMAFYVVKLTEMSAVACKWCSRHICPIVLIMLALETDVKLTKNRFSIILASNRHANTRRYEIYSLHTCKYVRFICQCVQVYISVRFYLSHFLVADFNIR